MYAALQKKDKKCSPINDSITKRKKLSNKPIQLKINPSKLNLVGEDHDESEKRRSKEFGIWARETSDKGVYRLENELLRNDMGGKEIGDPTHLRMINRLMEYDQHISDLQNDKVPATPEGLNIVIENGENLIGELEIEFINWNYNFQENVVVGEKGLPEPPVAIAIKIAEITKSYMRMKADKGKFNRQGKRLWQLREALLDVVKLESKENFRSLVRRRSMAMHKAANKNSGKIMLWKVGENHISDIKMFKNEIWFESPKYELTDLEEYNKYLKYKLKQPDDVPGKLKNRLKAIGELGKANMEDELKKKAND
ncbi:hypothetical protein [Pseudoalteromonas ostreae]|uniref:hypothetical protein n=1 Tax=Pseudoalteromonas ostreae TaxID=2774154 RepID=UPI001B389D9D|nr:hypothetical protein [Pseudoalteromonas ostreae]